MRDITVIEPDWLCELAPHFYQFGTVSTCIWMAWLHQTPKHKKKTKQPCFIHLKLNDQEELCFLLDNMTDTVAGWHYIIRKLAQTHLKPYFVYRFSWNMQVLFSDSNYISSLPGSFEDDAFSKLFSKLLHLTIPIVQFHCQFVILYEFIL